ncbi:MAG: hypothetical protein GY771_16685, partial [bacterium]|nr:hypothetical protein [bacterium]
DVSLEGRVEPVFGLSGSMTIYGLSVLPGGSGLIFSASDYDDDEGEGGVGLYNLDTSEIQWLLSRYEIPHFYHISPDGTRLLCGYYYDNDSYVLDIDSGERRYINPFPIGYVLNWYEGNKVTIFNPGEDYWGFPGRNGTESSPSNVMELFTYDVETGSRETLFKDRPNPPDESYWPDAICIVNRRLTQALVKITYTFDWEREEEIRYYDLISGSYENINLPSGAEMLGDFAPDDTKILSGDDIYNFGDNIGYIDVPNWRYVKITDSGWYDHNACWSPKGDTIYFIREQRVFKVNL